MIRFKKQAEGGPVYVMFLGNTSSITQMTPKGNVDIGRTLKIKEATLSILVETYRDDPQWTECY